jgi:hypothetical protein
MNSKTNHGAIRPQKIHQFSIVDASGSAAHNPARSELVLPVNMHISLSLTHIRGDSASSILG